MDTVERTSAILVSPQQRRGMALRRHGALCIVNDRTPSTYLYFGGITPTSELARSLRPCAKAMRNHCAIVTLTRDRDSVC